MRTDKQGRNFLICMVLGWAFFLAAIISFMLIPNVDKQEESQPAPVQTAQEQEVKAVVFPTITAAEAMVEEIQTEELEDIPFHYDCIPLTDEEQIALNDACERFDIDVALMCAVIYKETRFANIDGDNGRSIGYCQIQPRWWGKLMTEIGAEDLHVPADNFLTAAAILRRHYDAYGTWERALTAYNTGSAGSSRYADCVFAYWSEWTERLESEGINDGSKQDGSG